MCSDVHNFQRIMMKKQLFFMCRDEMYNCPNFDSPGNTGKYHTDIVQDV
jgi:hypothetical protein